MNKLMLIILQVCCLTAYINTASAETNTAKTVATLNQSWNAAFNNADMDLLTRLYAEDAILSPGNGAAISGQKDIRDLFQSFIDGGFHDHTIDVISARQEGDTIYQVANWQVLGKATDEGKVITVGGILTSIYQRDGKGNWKAVVHTWNAKN